MIYPGFLLSSSTASKRQESGLSPIETTGTCFDKAFARVIFVGGYREITPASSNPERRFRYNSSCETSLKVLTVNTV